MNKYDVNGEIERRKARLVAKGYSQKHRIDYNETYASVVRLESLRMSLSIACHLDLVTWQIDYIAAYLNSFTRENLYMIQPEGYVVLGMEDYVCHVLKTLYGTMQGGYDWWGELDMSFKRLGYTPSAADSCVRSKVVDGKLTLTNTYTDDVFGASSTPEGAAKAKAELASEYEIKDLGDLKMLLGMRINHDREKGTMTLDSTEYAKRVLKRFGYENCKPKYTPLPTGAVLELSQCPSTDEEREYMKDKPYHELLGCLMWLQVSTRPDLSYTVNVLSRFQANPGKAHWLAALHALQYVKATLHYHIKYTRNSEHGIKPYGYVDADYGGDPDTKRSTSGYVFIMAGGPVSWNSKRQATVTLSTTEAEYVGLTRAAQQCKWMFSFMDEINMSQQLPGTLRGDNESAIALTKNTKNHARAKHIAVKEHYIREQVKEGDIEVIHIASEDNIADIFTKPLPRPAHDRFCAMLGLF